MQENRSVEKTLDILEIVKKSFLLYKANLSLFLVISLLTYSVSLLEQLFHVLNISIGWFGLVTFIGGLIISFWGHIALLYAISERYSQKEVTIKEAFVNTKNKIWRFICVSIFCAFLFLGGLLLCVIPGLYWGVIFGLAGMLVVLEDRSFFDSLKRSKNLIRGYFWPVFLLGWLVGLIFLPFYAIYFLNIPLKVKILCVFFFSILYGPFGTAVTINLYHRLKQLKEGGELSQAEGVKKGGGCLGCLVSFGLFIVIIFLSSFWIKNLIGFIKTDKGVKYYEYLAKKVSPDIELPAGVSLERPAGYLVLKSGHHFLEYIFYGIQANQFFTFKVFAIPLKDLGIDDKAAIAFGEGVVWDKYLDYLIKQSPLTEKVFSDMEKEPAEIIKMGERIWVVQTLRQQEREYAKSRKVWVCIYTLMGNDAVFLSYGFDEKHHVPWDRRSEIKRILEGITEGRGQDTRAGQVE